MLTVFGDDFLPNLGNVGVIYPLRDEFSTDRAAGAVNGTAPDGIGPNRVAGAANVAIADGALVHTGTGTWTDASLYYASGVTRQPGLMMRNRVKFSSALQLSMFGFRTDQSTSQIGFNNTGLYINTGALLARRTSDGTSPTARALVTATYYDFYTVLRAAGKFVFTNTGTYPLLDIVDDWSSAATLYIGVNTLTSAATLTHDQIDVRQAPWLPVPLVSDGFGGTFGTTDGLGHAEGVAGGLGAGGASAAWAQRAGTWANSAGSAAASALSSGVAIATVPAASTPHVRATAKTTRAGGTIGVVVRYVDANNYIYSVHNGTGVNLRKVVAGVDSQVMAVTAATYAAGAEHTIVANGTKFRVLYNQMSIGSEQTITDAALQTGTDVGLYTTDTGNTVGDFRAYALGVEGQYAILAGFF